MLDPNKLKNQTHKTQTIFSRADYDKKASELKAIVKDFCTVKNNFSVIEISCLLLGMNLEFEDFILATKKVSIKDLRKVQREFIESIMTNHAANNCNTNQNKTNHNQQN